MDKQKWKEIALQLEPHLKEIHKIAKENELYTVSVASCGGIWWATYIDGGEIYSIEDIVGKTEVKHNQETYYEY